MSPSAMIASESIAGRPLSRSIVSTVTVLRPAKVPIGRRTSRHRTIGYSALRPRARSRENARGRKELSRALPTAVPRRAGVPAAGRTSNARAGDEITTRATSPVRRAVMYEPSTRSVRRTFGAAGSLTSISVSRATGRP